MDNHLYHIQKIHERELLKKKNVVSVGLGRKFKDGKPTDKICIVVGVSKKENVTHLHKESIIPSKLQDVETDVFELGEIKAQNDEDIDPKARIRPVRPGVSIGHKDISAGTFGCVVYKEGVPYILSNNHVIANSNNANIGDPIYQPGPHDGGSQNDKVAELINFVPIVFEGEVPPPSPEPPTEPPDNKPKCPIASFVTKILNSVAKRLKSDTVVVPVKINPLTTDNEIDGAIAKPTEQISNNIILIGVPNGIKNAEIDLPVKKYGRTTGFTVGTIVQIGTTVNVGYGDGKTATFVNQIVTSGMSQGGDSGSLVLTEDNKAVGLLFAGSAQATIINLIQTVLNKLNVTLEK